MHVSTVMLMSSNSIGYTVYWLYWHEVGKFYYEYSNIEYISNDNNIYYSTHILASFHYWTYKTITGEQIALQVIVFFFIL